MYKLDLAAMLQMLQEFRQNAVLQTEISSVPGAKGRFQVQLDMFDGKITSCSIRSGDGQVLLAGDDAFTWLQDLGALNWTVTLRQISTSALTQSSPALTPSPVLRSPIPRRSVYVGQEQMRLWPRKYRVVFVLIDGRKSVEQIAGLLSLSIREVEEVVYELQANRLIVLE